MDHHHYMLNLTWADVEKARFPAKQQQQLHWILTVGPIFLNLCGRVVVSGLRLLQTLAMQVLRRPPR